MAKKEFLRLDHSQETSSPAPKDGNWVDQISGSLAVIPDEDYQQFLEHCRAAREQPIQENAT